MQTWDEFAYIKTDIVCPKCWGKHEQNYLSMDREPNSYGDFRYFCSQCESTMFSRRKWTHKKEESNDQ